jgi:outer membrane protein OmpA-like peptidoglycan-associated protein
VKIASVCLSVIGFLGILAAPGMSQTPAPATDKQKQQESSPLYRVTVVARTTKAINYRHLSGPTEIDFRGTVLLPFSKGQASVESKRGAIRIQAQFDKLEPATRFGPEFLTYVLWAVSPEGRADNLGEVLINGSKSKLDVTAQLQAFALIVTAEPYFAVTQPSEVVVLENIVRPDTLGNVEEMDAKFDLLQRGQYTYVQGNSQLTALDSRTPFGLQEARNAVQIAKAAGAEQYASESFRKAMQLLQQAEGSLTHKGDKKQIEASAREAVQTAEDARAITVKRREEERLAQERAAAAEREANAKAQAEAAERATLQAQLTADRAAREKAEAETARAAALVQQQAAQAAAEQAARDRAAAEAARASAMAQQQVALAAADQASRDKVQAEAARETAQADAQNARRAAEQAEGEKTDLRAKLLAQLNTILQTRDSARGLIVNMSDVLFDTGSFTLKPGAREKLAKISGILLAHPGLVLQIEGHTDSVGSDQYNQQLSDRRAGSVQEFLVQQGVAAGSVTAIGFGKMEPVASNDTSEGRQLNRRVELVVNGADIGTTAGGSQTSRQ